MKYLGKPESYPFEAIRCYADFFLNKEIVDYYYNNNQISSEHWLDIADRVKKIFKFISEKKDLKLVGAREAIGGHTAKILIEYLQADIFQSGTGVGETEKRSTFDKITRLISRPSQEMEGYAIFLDHQPSSEEYLHIPEEQVNKWIEALYKDIRCIDLGPIHQIILICGSDALSVSPNAESRLNIELHILP